MRKAIILPVHPLLSTRLLLAETHPAISNRSRSVSNSKCTIHFMQPPTILTNTNNTNRTNNNSFDSCHSCSELIIRGDNGTPSNTAP